MISQEEVKRIATLARLQLTEAETAAMQRDLSQVLDYFEILKAVSSAESAQKGLPQPVALRSDAVAGSAAAPHDLVAQFPASKDGYLKVKAVL